MHAGPAQHSQGATTALTIHIDVGRLLDAGGNLRGEAIRIEGQRTVGDHLRMPPAVPQRRASGGTQARRARPEQDQNAAQLEEETDKRYLQTLYCPEPDVAGAEATGEEGEHAYSQPLSEPDGPVLSSPAPAHVRKGGPHDPQAPLPSQHQVQPDEHRKSPRLGSRNGRAGAQRVSREVRGHQKGKRAPENEARGGEKRRGTLETGKGGGQGEAQGHRQSERARAQEESPKSTPKRARVQQWIGGGGLTAGNCWGHQGKEAAVCAARLAAGSPPSSGERAPSICSSGGASRASTISMEKEPEEEDEDEYSF